MNKKWSISTTTTLAAMVLLLGWSPFSGAATCIVPSGTHPDIQTAIGDIGCEPIVIAAGTYVESPVIARTVSLTGAGSDQTFIQGQVQVTVGTVHLAGLHITAPADALWAHSGAEVSGFDLEVVNGAVQSSPIFVDGFESGDTSGWSVVTP